ncbi:MAG: aminoglycoside phosphotransferase family protein [Ignavibacteria bacterium]
MDQNPGIDVRQAKVMVQSIVNHHFEERPRRIIHHPSGLTNFVFLVILKKGEFFVRLNPDPAKLSVYIKEQWAISKATELGIPTLEILEVGNQVVSVPYMISRRVKGVQATDHPDKNKIIYEMGRYTSLINSIPTNDYGRTFNWSNNQLSRNSTWRDFLKSELNLEENLIILRKYHIFKDDILKKIQWTLLKADKLIKQPSLNHGDIRMKNIIVDRSGKIIAIIDWEDCLSTLAPAWDLSLALHDLSVDEKHIFIEGYGISPLQLSKISPVIKAINIINYAPEIDRLGRNKEKARLELYRARLRGSFDLYSI